MFVAICLTLTAAIAVYIGIDTLAHNQVNKD